MEGDNIEIVISDDTPSDITVVPSETTTTTPLSDLPQDGIEDLKRQLAESTEREKAARDDAANARRVADEESRRRNEAERIAQQNHGVATSATAEAREREYESIINAETAVTSRLQTLKDQYVKANTDGDFSTAADIQISIGRESAKLERLVDGRVAIEEQRKATPAPSQQQPVRETQDQFNGRSWSAQEYENVMRTYTPTTAAWLRNNPRYASDVSFRRQVQSAHGLLTARGIAPDTNDYFKGVEELIGARDATPEQPREESRPKETAAVSTAGKQSQARTSPTLAAAPSRTVPNAGDPGNTGGGDRVTLTPAQREMARMMFSDAKDAQGRKVDPDVAYARHWRQLQREGKLKDGGIVL